MTDFDATRAAMMALVGDRDDVRTVLAWMLAVNGRLEAINALCSPYDDPVVLARVFDGLDGHAVCVALERAFDELGLYERALARTE